MAGAHLRHETERLVLRSWRAGDGGREIFALANVGNTASWGLMERLGMRRRTALDFLDPRFEPPEDRTIVYSITPDEQRD